MKNRGVLLSALVLLLLAVSMSFAGTIIVKPGKFDHFIVEFPERTVAGEGFTIKVFVYDMSNNLITNFPESGREFKVTVSGSANIRSSHLNPASFPGGIAHVTITDAKAERIILSILPTEGNIPAYSKEIVISPNKLDHFVVSAPSAVAAGSNFEAKIVAKDAFDNTVADAELIKKNIKITSLDSLSLRTSGVLDFRDGTASVSLATEKTGDLTFEVLDTVSGSKGRSPNIRVRPAALGSFKVQAPHEATAGVAFEVVVSAYDLFGNAVIDYSSTGSGVVLQSSGAAKIEPSFVKPSQFRNNEAVVKAVYEKAEEISITAKEENKSQAGKSGPIRIHAATADHFTVLTPDNAVSGQPFKIKVEAYDRFDNVVKNFSLTGNTVALKTTGTGILSPASVSPPEFVEGVAAIEVTYDKAESFAISAGMQSAKGAERLAPAEKVHPVQKSEKVEKPVQALPQERKMEGAATPELKKEEKEVVREAKTERPAKEIKKQAPGKQAKKEVRIEETKKEAKAQAPVKEEKKQVTKEAKAVSLNNIATIEAKEKAMLVITLSPDGKFEYKEEIATRQGKEWLKIRLKPVVRKTEKSFKFRSAFIGDVLVEDDKTEQGAVNVFIELVPEKVTFDVAQLKNSLIVTVARP